MNKNVITLIVVLSVVLVGIVHCEKKESNSVDFKNLKNTEIGQDFVLFIKQHREQIKSLLLANGYNLDTDWATAKNASERDWLGTQVIATIKNEKINSISGTVSITGTRKHQKIDIVMPVFFSFYFRKFDNRWKLAVRDGYFVNPYEDKDSVDIDIPPEIYAGISRIFSDHFNVTY